MRKPDVPRSNVGAARRPAAQPPAAGLNSEARVVVSDGDLPTKRPARMRDQIFLGGFTAVMRDDEMLGAGFASHLGSFARRGVAADAVFDFA